eukprot:6346878-Amphidinium_carterae.2
MTASHNTLLVLSVLCWTVFPMIFAQLVSGCAALCDHQCQATMSVLERYGSQEASTRTWTGLATIDAWAFSLGLRGHESRSHPDGRGRNHCQRSCCRGGLRPKHSSSCTTSSSEDPYRTERIRRECHRAALLRCQNALSDKTPMFIVVPFCSSSSAHSQSLFHAATSLDQKQRKFDWYHKATSPSISTSWPRYKFRPLSSEKNQCAGFAAVAHSH